MVVGVVVPMASTAQSPVNGGAARRAGFPTADASDPEQKAAAARRTIEQMTEGALQLRRRASNAFDSAFGGSSAHSTNE